MNNQEPTDEKDQNNSDLFGVELGNQLVIKRM